MAYLTNYSFNKLIEMTQVKNIDKIGMQFFTKNIYDNHYLFYFFNQLELKKLFRTKILLSDNKAYIITYQKVPERIDNFSFILPVKGQVKYHMKLDCEALNRGFKNFFMPPEIVNLRETEPEKHKEIVDEIRNWFNQKNYTIERYEKLEINSLEITKNFNSYFPSKYNIEPILVSDSDKEENNFQWYISRKNDNTEVKIEFNYDEFLDKIILLIKQRDILCDTLEKDNLTRFDYMVKMTNEEITYEIETGKLSNFSFFINKVGIIKLKEFWTNHINLKNEALKILIEYFKWTYNFSEKQFDAIYLESFNLAKCKMCAI